MTEQHTYPSRYPPGSHWAVTVSWRILDMLEPGVLTLDQRALLAGMIAGSLVELHQNGLPPGVDEKK